MNMLDRVKALFRASRAPSTDSFDLRDSQKEALKCLARRFIERQIPHALIGGAALATSGWVRATKDLDFLVDSDHEIATHDLLMGLGFEVLQRGLDASNYLLGHLRVDVLYARRSYSKAMLRRALQTSLEGVEIRAAQPEDLIGLKLQALKNAPERAQDRVDIAALLRLRAATMNMALVREYAQLLGMEDLLDELSQPK